MDCAEIWGQFRRSWKNENPHRNRKLAKRETGSVPLGRGTALRIIADLRMFLKHCVSREWLSENWASRDHGMAGDSRIEPKEPFSSLLLEVPAPSRAAFVLVADQIGALTRITLRVDSSGRCSH